MQRSRPQSVSGRSTDALAELKSEIKFNILLLLRNRYPEGLQVQQLQDQYKRFFFKEINTKVFNPKASNLYKDNREFLGEDIEVISMKNKSFIRARQGCSEETMGLISNASSYQKVFSNQIYASSYRTEEDYNFQMKTEYPGTELDLEMLGVSDPMRQINSANSRAINLSSTNAHSSSSPSASLAPNGLSAGNTYSNYSDTIRKVASDQNPNAIPMTASTATSNAGLPLNYILPNSQVSPFTVVPTGTNTPYYIVGNTLYPGGTTLYTDNAQQPPVPQQQQNQSMSPPAPAPPPVVKAEGKGKKLKKLNKKSLNEGSSYHHCRRPGCKKFFRRYKLLENHERIAHYQDGDAQLVCATAGCKLSFNDKKLLQHHESRCLLKPHRCRWESCDKTFRTSKLLHGHISAVHRKIGRNMFKCTIPGCNQSYPDSTKLKTHEMRCRFKYDTLREMANETIQANHLVVAAPTTNDDQSHANVNLFIVKNEEGIDGVPCNLTFDLN